MTLPDVKGRQEILELYISKITHDIAIDIGFWAKKTSGFSGADLQNLVNTAAIRAAVKGKFSFLTKLISTERSKSSTVFIEYTIFPKKFQSM